MIGNGEVFQVRGGQRSRLEREDSLANRLSEAVSEVR